MPAVTLGIFMLAGLALARPADGRPGRFGLPFGRTLVALGWLVIAVAPLLGGVSYARLQQSGLDLKTRGGCASAKREALSSLSLSAKRPQAYAIVGVCDLEQGFAQAAVPAMAAGGRARARRAGKTRSGSPTPAPPRASTRTRRSPARSRSTRWSAGCATRRKN